MMGTSRMALLAAASLLLMACPAAAEQFRNKRGLMTQIACSTWFPNPNGGRDSYFCYVDYFAYPGDRCFATMTIGGAKISNNGKIKWLPRTWRYPVVDCS